MKPGTIVAPITGTQAAAVAVVRLSGPDAWQIGRCVFPSLPSEPESHRAYYGHFVHGDDGLAIPFAEGRSFTGEETLELNLHGSPASVRLLLQACYMAGARPADPGEFTLRAFMNGRIDLAQAEAIRDTIEALTEEQLARANRSREGELKRKLAGVEQDLTKVLAAIEASVDFSEEIGDADPALLATKLAAPLAELNELRATVDSGRILREGFRIALVGAPNAGKSSLLNSMLGFRRAIVSEVAGTTRDTVEEFIDLDGVPVRLVDTAGLRAAPDMIEAEGIERSTRAAGEADLVLHIIDLSAPVWMNIAGRTVWAIGNKADIARGTEQVRFAVSALTGVGISELLQAIKAEFGERIGPIALNDRHRPLVDAAHESVLSARAALEAETPPDLVVTLLRDALYQLGLVTGQTTSSDILERIFADFCIGK